MSASAAYWVAVAAGIVVCAMVCAACRRRPGPWVVWAGRAISLVLALDAVAFVVVPLADGSWSVHASLPLALCNMALLVAAVACWEPSWQPGRRAHLLLGARRHAAGGGHPRSGCRVPPAGVLRVRRRSPRRRHGGPVPRGRPPAAATARRGEARVRRDGGLHRLRRVVRLAHRLQLHVPGSDPGDGARCCRSSVPGPGTSSARPALHSSCSGSSMRLSATARSSVGTLPVGARPARSPVPTGLGTRTAARTAGRVPTTTPELRPHEQSGAAADAPGVGC